MKECAGLCLTWVGPDSSSSTRVPTKLHRQDADIIRSCGSADAGPEVRLLVDGCKAGPMQKALDLPFIKDAGDFIGEVRCRRPIGENCLQRGLLGGERIAVFLIAAHRWRLNRLPTA